MQLVAYGAQDVHLTGNPEITLFKLTFKRHTNYSKEEINVTPSGSASFGNEINFTISRNGDLIHKLFFSAEVYATVDSDNGKWAWVKNLGTSIIESVQVQIGGTTIDKQFGVWMDVWHELSKKDDHSHSYDICVGNTSSNTTLSKKSNDNDKKTKLFVPLNFWFCRSVGLSLPLIALQYHEVKVQIKLREQKHIYVKDSVDPISGEEFNVVPVIKNAKLLTTYIYLDTNERRKFAQESHEYIITQVQEQNDTITSPSTSGDTTMKFNFNHPTKLLTWIGQLNKFDKNNTNEFLGNDRQSCTKNFIIRYCLSNLRSSSEVVSGDKITFGLDYNNTILLLTNGLGDSGLSSSSLSDRLVLGGTNQLNSSYSYFSDIVKVLSSATVTWNSQQADNANFKVTDVLWNSISVPELLSADTCSKIVSSELESSGSTSSNVFSSVSSSSVLGSTVYFKSCNNYGFNLDGSGDCIKDSHILLNGQDRIEKLDSTFFNHIVPYVSGLNSPPPGIYSYGFGFDLSSDKPDGTCNFSRIDNAELKNTFNTNESLHLTLFGYNFNCLRIMGGMGGLAYSN